MIVIVRLDESEILQAIRDYVRDRGTVADAYMPKLVKLDSTGGKISAEVECEQHRDYGDARD